MGLIEVISIVLLIMECVLSIVLVFEDFCENSLSVSRLTIVIDGLAISLNAHAPSVDSIELSLDIR